jgi:hypothetical protein
LGVGGVEGEREKGEEIMARLPRVSPLPCVHRLEDKDNKRASEMPAGERERWLARVASLVDFVKGEEKREEKKKK